MERTDAAAREQLRAIGDVLNVMSRSPYELEPVLQAVIENAVDLCGATNGSIVRLEGTHLRLAVSAGTFVDLATYHDYWRERGIPSDRSSLTGRVLLDRASVQVEDALADPEYQRTTRVAAEGVRTMLGVPLVRKGSILGVILLRRTEVALFTPDQVRLVEAFADQTAIAIENVRLFTETTAALQRQTATAEILRVISSSPADLQPVLDVILTSAQRYCGAEDVLIHLREGDELSPRAHAGPITGALPSGAISLRVGHGAPPALAVFEKRTVHVADLQASAEFPIGQRIAREVGFRTVAAAPLLANGMGVGAITLRRSEVRPFSEREIELLETFASQAAIAIENVRLFNETKEALAQQTATAEVLKTISRSAFDLGKVLETVVENAARLTAADVAWIAHLDGEVLRVGARYGRTPEILEQFNRRAPAPVGAPMTIGSKRSPIVTATQEARTIRIDDAISEDLVAPGISAAGGRSVVFVPLIRDGRSIGALAVARQVVHPFSDREVEIVQTFADQAAIAMENVRLFNETKEALEQQTAVARVLQSMSRSAFDLDRVLAAVVENAARLANAQSGFIFRHDSGSLVHAASYGMPDEIRHLGRDHFPADRTSVAGRVVLARGTVEVADALADPELMEQLGEQQAELGFRTMLGVPIMREDAVIGVLSLRRNEVRPFGEREIAVVRTFADQAAIAIENVRLFNETKEALEQQTATSEVLEVIGTGGFRSEPVFQAIVERAARLCNADGSWVWLRDGDEVTCVARHGADPSVLPVGVRQHIDREMVVSRALIEGRTVHVPDVRRDSELTHQEVAPTRLGVPIQRDGNAIGVIGLSRSAPRPFSRREIEIVETFARQASIAIENTRLFNETKEALERQTATGEILRVIAESPTDVQPVLDAIAENAARYCQAEDATVMLPDGPDLRAVAHFGPLQLVSDGEPIRSFFYPLDRGSLNGRAFMEGRILHTPDILAAADEYPRGAAAMRRVGVRAGVAAPLLREGSPIGTIALRRRETRPFTDKQIELLRTFAAQAVIAIENVRLFNETKEALDRQTATAEVLKAIGGSALDLAGVLNTVISHATRLAAAENGFIYRADGDVLHMVAAIGEKAEVMREWQADNPIETRDVGSATGRAFVARRSVHIPDVLADDTYTYVEAQKLGDFRTLLAVPLMREGQALGVIAMWRTEVRPFSGEQIRLVESFADQAVIAIENVRLFNETKEALEQQTAVAEVLASIGRSAFDLESVLNTITERAGALCGADSAQIGRVNGDRIEWVAGYGPRFPTGPDGSPLSPFIPLSGPTLAALSIRTRQPQYIEDARTRPELPQDGPRTRFAVPLVRDGNALGTLLVFRVEVRPFSDREMRLVETFADQAAIAIENVRLFNETKEALDQQTATAEVLRTINRTALDLPATLQAVVLAAGRLCDADFGWLNQLDEHVGEVPGWAPDPTRFVGRWSRVGAYYGRTNDLERRVSDALSRVTPVGDLFPMYRQTATSLAILDRRTVNVRDWTVEPDLQASGFAKAMNARALLIVPMIREGDAIGAIALARSTARAFTEREVALAQTFADQAVIAIENVRLFNEIQEKSSQLEIAGRHKSEFLANMSHELRTPLNAIIGFSEVLLQGMFGELNQKQREYQEDVLSSGRHLLTLINDILDLSKIEAGRVELELAEFSLPAALDNGVTMVRERAARHGIRVTVDIDGVDLIVADERKVKQIVANLLSNAVKFTPDGGRVEVRAAREDGEVRIAIRDTGIGIDEADRERIFEEFQQASRDPERSREGTGLGLALSKRYVELHGGRIWVESEVGQGSTFTFSLPLMAAGKEG